MFFQGVDGGWETGEKRWEIQYARITECYRRPALLAGVLRYRNPTHSVTIFNFISKGGIMLRWTLTSVSLALGCLCGTATLSGAEKADKEGDGWICLFDGETLKGWKISENPSSFDVKDGAIVAHGPRAHLFYQGPVENHDFKDFHFKADVMTT